MKRKLWLVWGMVLMIAFALTACNSSDDENKSSAKAKSRIVDRPRSKEDSELPPAGCHVQCLVDLRVA